jgi:hypothetical protein
VRLNVRIVSAKQCLGAFNSQRFRAIDVLAAAVVALARIALGILVIQDAAIGLEDTRARLILRGNELDVLFLSAFFGGYSVGDFRIK